MVIFLVGAAVVGWESNPEHLGVGLLTHHQQKERERGGGAPRAGSAVRFCSRLLVSTTNVERAPSSYQTGNRKKREFANDRNLAKYPSTWFSLPLVVAVVNASHRKWLAWAQTGVRLRLSCSRLNSGDFIDSKCYRETKKKQHK